MFTTISYWFCISTVAFGITHVSRATKDWILIFCSLVACGLLDLRGLIILSVLIATTAYILRLRKQSQTDESRHYIPLGLVVVLVTLFVFKYVPATSWFGWSNFITIAMPLGISFLSFRLIHVLIEANKETLPEYNQREFILYAVFFPIWIAGPIQRFDEFLEGRKDQVERDDWINGLFRVSVGIVKAFLISDLLLPQLYAAGQSPNLIVNQLGDLTAIETWRYLAITYFILYFDFSGYTDIAIGSSRILGFKIAENFNFPFLATNMSDYWKRWHMSLARWCQTYVYMPLLAHTRSATLPLFGTFFIMGVWHAAAPHWIMWGIWHACGVFIYRTWEGKVRQLQAEHGYHLRPPPYVGNIITLAFVMCAGAFTSLHPHASIIDSFRLLASAFGF